MTTKRAILFLVVMALAGGVAKLLADRRRTGKSEIDAVEEWGKESFPASDPPAHW